MQQKQRSPSGQGDEGDDKKKRRRRYVTNGPCPVDAPIATAALKSISNRPSPDHTTHRSPSPRKQSEEARERVEQAKHPRSSETQQPKGGKEDEDKRVERNVRDALWGGVWLFPPFFFGPTPNKTARSCYPPLPFPCIHTHKPKYRRSSGGRWRRRWRGARGGRPNF